MDEQRRQHALDNWLALVTAVCAAPERPSEHIDRILQVAKERPSEHIDRILQVAKEIEEEAPDASLCLCEHAQSESQRLDPQSNQDIFGKFKEALLALMKSLGAAGHDRTLKLTDPKTRGEILMSFYYKYKREHELYLEAPQPTE